jgi:hypothetical protein
MLANATQTVALDPVMAAAPMREQGATTLIWLCLAALLLLSAVIWFRNRIHSDTGIDPMNFMKRMISNPAQSGKPAATRTPGAPRSHNSSVPLENRDVRSNSGSDSRSSGTTPQKDDLRAILREVVQEELAKLRSEISADLQGSLKALANRIDGMQVESRSTPIRKPLIETPESLPVQRAATETDLLTYWRSLRGSNQVSASHMLSLAAASQLTLSEAPGLSTTDPLARLGFLLTDGQGTVWFIPRPAFTPLDLSGVYSFPQERYLAGAITDVVRFARWQGGQIVAPGEAK